MILLYFFVFLRQGVSIALTVLELINDVDQARLALNS